MTVLENKVALITGAGNGIGRATANLFAKEGARVVITDLDEAGLEETHQQIAEAGGEVVSVQGDVSAREDVQRMVDTAIGQYDSLNILINNAGINRDTLTTRIKDGDVRLMTDEQWDAVLKVNLTGTWLCSQLASVPMMAQKYGRIVNTSSIGALGNVGQSNYAASKAGVIGLTKTLALEWARFNIAVNCVAPGATRTQMTAGIPEKIMEVLINKIPFRRLAEPGEIASAHLFLASDQAGYITGQTLFVDGGISIGV